MSRLIFLFAIVALVYLLLKSFRKQPKSSNSPSVAEDMVRCAHCGLHCPAGESIRAEEKYFCCADHRDVHQG